ncbi:hypothetical protein DPMN_114121 [Dreissena polymorpha]|uniref:Uncharacterized protein n=1 Tax=Dreissena polymorpha TaxID=45954 RepID=A0A9D4KIS6_DREPO|nr:hypothetical protein DPMN_114121 [Dreissena polymorpha]
MFLLMIVNNQRRREREFRPRLEVAGVRNIDFVSRYRVNQTTAQQLVELLGQDFARSERGEKTISPETKSCRDDRCLCSVLGDQSPIYTDQSPFSSDKSPFYSDQSLFYSNQSPFYSDQSPFYSDQSPFYSDQSPDQSPFYSDQSPFYSDQSPFYSDQLPFYSDQSPVYSNQSPFSGDGSNRRRTGRTLDRNDVMELFPYGGTECVQPAGETWRFRVV